MSTEGYVSQLARFLDRLHTLFQEAERHGLEVGLEAAGYGSTEEVLDYADDEE